MQCYIAKIQQTQNKCIEEGKAEGKTEIYHAWYADCQRRKQDAMENGMTFLDPLPPKPDTFKQLAGHGDPALQCLVVFLTKSTSISEKLCTSEWHFETLTLILQIY